MCRQPTCLGNPDSRLADNSLDSLVIDKNDDGASSSSFSDDWEYTVFLRYVSLDHVSAGIQTDE